MNNFRDTVNPSFLKRISENATITDWNDYKWQLKNSIKDVETLEITVQI